MNKDSVNFVLLFLFDECPSLSLLLKGIAVDGEKSYSNLLFWSTENGFESLCYAIKDKLPRTFNSNWMLRCATIGGHENLCRLAKEWGADYFELMFLIAANYGNECLCRLAKEWGADNFEAMLLYASSGGHESLCRLAKEWGAKRFTCMLVNAANENISRLAKEWMQ